MKHILILFIVIFFALNYLSAQYSKKSIAAIDSIEIKKVKLIGLPIIFYTPETNAGFGGGGQMFLLQNSNRYNLRKSNILFSGIYTLNSQILIEVKPEIYLNKGDYMLDMRYQFKIFPNTFWGIGGGTPDTNEEGYNMTSHEFSTLFLKRLPPFLNFGFEYFMNDYRMTETQEGGLLDSGNIMGSNGARTSGLGVVFNQDKRDNTASPNRGNLLQLKAQFSSKNLGATADYNRYIFDVRHYQPLNTKNILAFQVYSESIFGDIPFQAKAWYGGGAAARGYFRGRYIDDLMYVIQAEYRWKFHERWSAAGFALVGEVFDSYNHMIENLKPSAGGGIRYKFSKEQDTLLRLDLGVGIDGNSGIYFGINEAF